MENRCFIDWNQVREKAAQDDWAKALVRFIKDAFTAHQKVYPFDPPTGESGWGHYYFCADCGTNLIYDIQKPYEHRCATCQKVYSGSPYDNTWINSTHGVIGSMLQYAAILSHLPEAGEDYKGYIRKTILFYTEHYEEYQNFSTHCGQGKIQSDNLTEAWLVQSLAQTMHWVEDLKVFSDEERREIGERLFRPECELLIPQIKRIHNIHATMGAAVAAAAEVLDDDALFDRAVNGAWGFTDQMKGVREDGVWFEVSDSYHSLTLNAFLSIARIAGRHGFDLFRNPVLASMGRVYARLAYPDGTLPAYHDGWYGHHIYDYAYQFEQLARIYDTSEDPYYAKLLEFCYTMKEANRVPTQTGFARDSIPALLYGPRQLQKGEALPLGSDLFPVTGLAILRNKDLRINLKSTLHGGGHDHNDKCSIEVYANGEYFSCDPGTSGYSLPLTGRWSRTSLAHNMVCVDGLRQKDSDGEISDFTTLKATARANAPYDHAAFTRTIELTEDGYRDETTVRCDAPSTVDWVFHCIGEPSNTLSLSPAVLEPLAGQTIAVRNIPEASYDPRFIENGYDQLMDLHKAYCESDIELVFQTASHRYTLVCKGEPGTEIFLGKCYGISYLDLQNFILIRRKGVETTRFNVFVSITQL